MFNFLGRLTTTHPWKVCALWLVAGVALMAVAPDWKQRAQDDDIRFLPERCDSVRGYRLLEQGFPQDVYASRVIFAVESDDGPLSAADLKVVDDLVAEANKLREDEPELQIGKVNSHRDPFVGKRFMSADGKCTLINIALSSPYLAVKTRDTVERIDARLRQRLEASGGAHLKMHTTGPAGVGRDLIAASASSLDNTTLATVVLVIVILLAVYRSPLLALVPLVTIGIAVWVAMSLLSLCTLIPGFYLVNVSQIFAVVMLYGAGTDYCLFLISRYREELAEGKEGPAALAGSVKKVGGALAASAATVICGLGLMGLAEFAKVRSGGPAIALSLTVALTASLTLTPALMRILGKALFWPVGVPQKQGPWVEREDLWTRISRVVVRRPIAVWVAAIAILLPLAIIGLQVKPNYRATGELSNDSSSVQGLQCIQKHFNAGETGPITVLLVSKTDWSTPEGQAYLAHLSQGFTRIDNVAEVRSLTQPLGTPEPIGAPPKEAPKNAKRPALGDLLSKMKKDLGGLVDQQSQKAAQKFYVAKLPAADGAPERYVTRIDVVLKTDPFDPASIPTLNVIQTWLRESLPRTEGAPTDVETAVYGVTVGARDLATVTEKDRTRINGLVLLGIFLILMVLVRRPWLAAYLLVTVLFSYLATLGATTLLATYVHGRPFGEVDWRVPFFLFTILVAVGEDYNILLMTRAVKERRRRGAVEGMRVALARTGGTITSCGLIMAGTFATLTLAGLGTLVQIGFALAFGVLLDTFIVRPFLVPALTVFVWQRQEEGAEEEQPATLPLRPAPPQRQSRRAA